LILPESLLFTLESLLVWLVVRTDWRRARPARFALYGLLVGLLALGRASHALVLLLALPLARAAAPTRAGAAKRAAAAAGAFALGSEGPRVRTRRAGESRRAVGEKAAAGVESERAAADREHGIVRACGRPAGLSVSRELRAPRDAGLRRHDPGRARDDCGAMA